jgi:transglutaminase-like putative cysteine protease
VDLFLRQYWRVVPDPPEAEYVQSPSYQLRVFSSVGILSGDCDDAATLAAALVAVQGYPCWFVAFRMPNESEFSHVFLRCNPGGYFVDIDPIVSPDVIPITGMAETMQVNVWP